MSAAQDQQINDNAQELDQPSVTFSGGIIRRRTVDPQGVDAEAQQRSVQEPAITTADAQSGAGENVQETPAGNVQDITTGGQWDLNLQGNKTVLLLSKETFLFGVVFTIYVVTIAGVVTRYNSVAVDQTDFRYHMKSNWSEEYQQKILLQLNSLKVIHHVYTMCVILLGALAFMTLVSLVFFMKYVLVLTGQLSPVFRLKAVLRVILMFGITCSIAPTMPNYPFLRRSFQNYAYSTVFTGLVLLAVKGCLWCLKYGGLIIWL